MESLLPLAADIGARLKERGETLAVSESSSGGLISAALLAQAGASRFYRGGGIIYAPNAYYGLMGLTKKDLGDMRSSTEPYALMLARTIKKRCRTRWGLSETGASGPSGNPYGDAAGHTCIALVGNNTETAQTIETGLANRPENMRLFAKASLELLRDQLA